LITAILGIASAIVVIGALEFALLMYLNNAYQKPTANRSGPMSVIPSASIIVPARNEAESLEAMVDSVLSQEGVQEIVIVDDGSTDGTAEIAARLASRHTVVRVLDAPALEQGWTGKANALKCGSMAATAEVLIFADADVTIEHGAISAILIMMHDEQLDFVGGIFKLKAESWIEALLAPVFCVTSYLALALTARHLGAATGALMAVRRHVYDSIGGHDSIAGKIVDDVSLARTIHAAGFRDQFLDMSTLVEVRLFAGIGGFVNAITRSTIAFLGGRPLLWYIITVVMTTLHVASVIALLYLALGSQSYVDVFGPAWCVHILGAIGYGIASMPYIYCTWLHSRSPLWGIAFPIAVAVLLIAVMIASIKALRSSPISWRGREYPPDN